MVRTQPISLPKLFLLKQYFVLRMFFNHLDQIELNKVKNDLKLPVPLFIDFMLLLIMELYLSLVEGEKVLVQVSTKPRLFFCL